MSVALKRVGLLIGLSLAGCNDGPVAVSDTEIWTLRLEQLEDGQPTAGRNAFPRRGTIWVQLRLNRTSQPDPTCSGASDPNVTTVLASATVPAARLQAATSGSFDGSWNCHGFRATLRLDDGSRYELTSNRPATTATEFELDDQLGWRNGLRRGVFSLLPERKSPVLGDSHVDVVVRNETGEPKLLELRRGNLVIINRVQIGYDGGADVPAGGPITFSWPAHISRWIENGAFIPSNRTWTIRSTAGSDTVAVQTNCVLGANHPDALVVTLLNDGTGECSQGWLGESYVELPREAYLRPDGADTVRVSVLTRGIDSVWAADPHPALEIQLDSLNQTSGSARLQLVAKSGLPLVDYGVVVWGRETLTGDSVWTVMTVHAYDLELAVVPDSLVVAPGADSALRISIQRSGIVAAFMEVALDPENPVRFQGAFAHWSFDETPSLDSVAFLNFRASSRPGSWRLTVCATYAASRDPCRPLPFVITIAAPAAGQPARMVMASNHSGTEVAGGPVSRLPAVRVANSLDGSVAGVTITFRLADSVSGTISDSVVVTDSQGIAQLGGWQLDPRVGTQTVIAEAPVGSGINPIALSFPINVRAGPPALLGILAGNNQTAPAGTAVAVPPRVFVRDAFGNPVVNVVVNFGVESGGGSVTGGSQVTDASGEAEVGSWVLGSTPGTNVLVAFVLSGSGPPPVTFFATGQ